MSNKAITVGEVTGTSVAGTSGVRVDLELDDQKAPTGQEVFAHSCLQYRPASPTDGDSFCEVVAWHRGDEAVVIASKDRRFEVALEEGEAVLTNMPDDLADQVLVKMTAGGKVLLGKPGGDFEPVATKSDITAIWDLLTTWTTVANDGGAALKASAVAIYVTDATFKPAIGSDSVEADGGEPSP